MHVSRNEIYPELQQAQMLILHVNCSKLLGIIVTGHLFVSTVGIRLSGIVVIH